MSIQSLGGELPFRRVPDLDEEEVFMPSESERRFLDEVGADLSAEERAALPRIPIACLVRCAVRFVSCGPTRRECQEEFIECILRCFGVGRGDGDGGEGGGAGGAEAGGAGGGGTT
ncbi:MAG TPA: hypothetical protein VHG08_15225 [Longimicrobium sp.]|nr:hypothetical protein [Longimicrobium sp.]